MNRAVEGYSNGGGKVAEIYAAYPIFRKAAESGDPVAQYFMGHASQYANARSFDPVAAKKWYALAAEQGVAEAYGRLGFLALKGIGEEVDESRALDHFRAAQASDAFSRWNLARLIIGSGEPNEEAWAIQRLENLVADGNREAMYWLGHFHSKNLIKGADPDRGSKLLRQASDEWSSRGPSKTLGRGAKR